MIWVRLLLVTPVVFVAIAAFATLCACMSLGKLIMGLRK